MSKLKQQLHQLRTADLTTLSFCAICKNELDTCCIKCDVEEYDEPGSGCTFIVGTYGHKFHVCCINLWLVARTSCPLSLYHGEQWNSHSE